MKNRITISIPFSFKGENFHPSCTLDLDKQMQTFGSIPCLFTFVANECGISVYSYEHDVMMMGEMVFDNAEGFAVDFIHGNQFDSEGFMDRWIKQRLNEQLQKISQQRMNIDDLEAHPELKASLLDAYEAGKADARLKGSIHSTTDPLF